MKVGVQGRNRLQSGGQKFGLDEFDAMVSSLSGWTNRQHNDDGAHTNVTAQSVTLEAVRNEALKVVSGRSDLGAGVAFSGVITPDILLTDAINYSPVGIDSAFCLRLSSDALCAITGIQDGPRMTPISGRLLLLFNVGVNTLVLRHEAVSSLPDFRFRLQGTGDVLLPPNTACLLYYDPTSRRWGILASSNGVGTVNDSEYNAGDSGAAIELDWSNGIQQIVTLTDDAAVTLVNPRFGQDYRIIFVQGTPGGRVPTFDANVIIENTPNATDLVDGAIFLLTLVYTAEGGGSYLGYYAPADATSPSGSGVVAQVVHAQDGSVSTTTTNIPFDDTIPQNTEGAQVLSLAITPTLSGNDLDIAVEIFATTTNQSWVSAALFRDSGADALAATAAFNDTNTAGMTIPLRCRVAAGSVAATTFKVRIGPHSGETVTFNGQSGGRKFGGVAASTITITELVP